MRGHMRKQNVVALQQHDMLFIFYFSSHTFTFQLLDTSRVVTHRQEGVVPPPPVFAFIFSRA